MKKVLQRCAQALGTQMAYYQADGKLLAVSAVDLAAPKRIALAEDALLAEGEWTTYDGGGLLALGPAQGRGGYLWLENVGCLNSANAALLAALIPMARTGGGNERPDVEGLYRDIFFGRLQPVEVVELCKVLHIDPQAERCVALCCVADQTLASAKRILSSIFPKGKQDQLLELDAQTLALVHTFRQDSKDELVEALLATADTLQAELDIRPALSLSGNCGQVTELEQALRQARQAMEVGTRIDPGQALHVYEGLALELYLYQVPQAVSLDFLQRVAPQGCGKSLDEEMRQTIQKFFQNNLNVSETARQMYLHRNTLVYRLDKLQKLTGLDLRRFDDAVTFKIMMTLGSFLN